MLSVLTIYYYYRNYTLYNYSRFRCLPHLLPTRLFVRNLACLLDVSLHLASFILNTTIEICTWKKGGERETELWRDWQWISRSSFNRVPDFIERPTATKSVIKPRLNLSGSRDTRSCRSRRVFLQRRRFWHTRRPNWGRFDGIRLGIINRYQREKCSFRNLPRNCERSRGFPGKIDGKGCFLFPKENCAPTEREEDGQI